MNLDYKILWFENDKGSFNAKKRLVKRVVENFGFIFSEPRNEIDDKNIDVINFQIYDLIIADLNLDNDVKGTGLLEKIRDDKGVYTEVVFYSTIGERALREELKNFEIDGVYCAGRADDDFREKVGKVIQTTIKKVQDVNNTRGLVIAESITLENEIEEILLQFFNSTKGFLTAEEKDGLLKSIYQKKVTQQESFGKLLSSISYSDLQQLIENDVLTASNGLDALNGILKLRIKSINIELQQREIEPAKKASLSEKSKLIGSLKTELIKFQDEILKVRNTLAHVKEEAESDGTPYLRSLNKKDGTVIIFNDEKYTEIRSLLKKHKKNFLEISQHLQEIHE